MSLHHVKANFRAAEGIRREVWQGEDHLVVPVVMICEESWNGALVPMAEFSRFPEAWNGRPVPVLHPEEHGRNISANRPDIIERNTIGSIFNTHVEGAKLKAEAWLNIAKAERLGFGPLLRQLESGEVIEVSTGYFADDETRPGEHDGVPYQMIHRNIRPDHLALLPGEIGACSVADGCGTRVNSKKESLAMKVNDAWAVITRSLGLNANCQCEENSMDIVKEAEGLVKSNALDAKQLAAIQKMAPEDREVMAAFISALGNTGGGDDPADVDENEGGVPEEEKPPMAMKDKAEKSKANGKDGGEQPGQIDVNSAEFNDLIANKVHEGMRRERVLDKLTANEANAFDEQQLKAMSTDALETYEKSIRPADYSGQGGFAANSDAIDTNVTPMPLRGVLGGKKKEG